MTVHEAIGLVLATNVAHAIFWRWRLERLRAESLEALRDLRDAYELADETTLEPCCVRMGCGCPETAHTVPRTTAYAGGTLQEHWKRPCTLPGCSCPDFVGVESNRGSRA